ncbi:Os02g0784100 [Oryza sativa Japonica Group]|uniref:Os02g0784100 protein n=1 Tax=Oryza sativa subsp. japonica TaxID=39947 RepID=Q0DWZ8_ORYSJ|nr:Os02g0784100 [Oryza sativa Japonica Group]|eukprot:NP_001048326.2 Os02g0784100 [Oryza sativa Japonica Group]
MGRGGGGRWKKEEEEELKAAKRGYREAVAEGNREEEARWANVIGDIHKRRGEYVEALRWLRIDYEVSVKYLPQRHLLPSCQSLGEVHLRLGNSSEALTYQKKHLQLAKEADDLVEQQRGSTQLGRTYYEILLRSENDHSAIRNAKKYFKSSMKLARVLKENPSSQKSLFLKELIDAYNNMGMLELELDNYEEAEKLLVQGLKICDEEEVHQYDDARSRLHHNLGNVYIELRNWNRAKGHIEKDIEICRKIRHTQGEAKGFINLGEVHSRVQKYEDAKLCYNKALQITKCLEDEDALMDQIHQNIETVTKAAKVLEEMKIYEQKLKKLARDTSNARGTSKERKLLLEQYAWLANLMEKARMITAWPKLKEFSKGQKRVANELHDKEKQSDSLLVIGESYQKLRNFSKARKWCMKSWNMYRSIGNLEGQALAKVNIGNVLDSCGDWAGGLSNVQLDALENMHYSHMVRFDNIEEAKKLQQEIDNLKRMSDQHEARDTVSDYCSETESEDGNVSDNILNTEDNDGNIANNSSEEFDDDVVLASLVHKSRSSKTKASKMHSSTKNVDGSCGMDESPEEDVSKSFSNHYGRKRVRVVISDDEAEEAPEIDQSKRTLTGRADSLSTSERIANTANRNRNQHTSHPIETREVDSVCTPCPAEESICSFKSGSPVCHGNDGPDLGASSIGKLSVSKPAASGSKVGTLASNSRPQGQNAVGLQSSDADHKFWVFKIGEHLVYLDANACTREGAFSIESLKVEVACVYYLQIPDDKRSKGLLPIIGELKCCGKVLDDTDSRDYIDQLASEQKSIDVVIDVIPHLIYHVYNEDWVPKRLMKLYVDFCTKLSEAPNKKLLKKLYNLEVSEDEVIVSDCGLQDLSITPFLDALKLHKTIAVLDLSHNMLGNQTIERLQQIFSSSSQTYGGLTLDLHCNRFGPTALFQVFLLSLNLFIKVKLQICECAVMTNRLEVLNLSGNRLTDACGSYLFTVLQKCKECVFCLHIVTALYSLNVEQCSITSRTVQKMADALHEGSVLSHLSLGNNNPISGNTMLSLLSKLASLKRFSELSLTGIKLNKLMADKLCLLAQSSCLSGFLLGGTNIGSGCEAIGVLLSNPQCSLRSLTLDRCNLGLAGIVGIIQALAGNDRLEELRIAENTNLALQRTLQYDEDAQDVSPGTDQNQRTNAEANDRIDPDKMEVPDSEDEEAVYEDTRAATGSDGSCASSCQRNSSSGCHAIQELADAIISAKQLKVLDLSRNGLSEEDIQSLYSAWASGPRGDGMARRHVAKEVVHFAVDGMNCCGLKPCCRRDLQM